MKHVAILCGGQSYEHEVSIITGIQVAENIDTTQYTFSLVYFDKDNQAFWLKNFKRRQDFKTAKRIPVDLVKRDGEAYLSPHSRWQSNQRVDVCYLAFHGGSGESGPVQGLLEVLDVPMTSPSQEGSVIAMNKSLTKEVLHKANVSVLPSMSVHSATFLSDTEPVLNEIKSTFSLPVIIKPAHLGSSIAIEIAHTEVELEKHLQVAARVDSEILVEPALSEFTEYNVSVRSNQNELEFSLIEEPVRGSEILSFDDKYSGGSKKTGGKQGSGGGGMELLDRIIPAKIDDTLAQEIKTTAGKIYRAMRLSGPLRIDFMYHDEKLYCTEVNPIPGSMSFYLWEPTGEQFRDQITHSIEDALWRHQEQIVIKPYDTDIVEKFIAG